MNKIDGLGNSIALSDSITLETVIETTDYYECIGINSGGFELLTIQVGDILRCEGVWNTSYFAVVDYVDTTLIRLNKATFMGDGRPQVNDTLTRFGHISNDKRQGVLYLTHDDKVGPALVVYDKITDNTLKGKEVVKIGDLGGVIDRDFGTISGMGAYIKNGYVSGVLQAKSGSNIYTKYEIDNIIFLLKSELDAGLESLDLQSINEALIAANNRATSAMRAINEMISDNIITPMEKETIGREWDVIKSEKHLIINQVSKYNISTEVYEAVYDELRDFILPILEEIGNTEIDDSSYRNKFLNYYNEKARILKLASDEAYSFGSRAYISAEEAKLSAIENEAEANKLLGYISNIVSDEYLTGNEIKSLKDQIVELDITHYELEIKSNFYYTPSELIDPTNLWYQFNVLHEDLHFYLESVINPIGEETDYFSSNPQEPLDPIEAGEPAGGVPGSYFGIPINRDEFNNTFLIYFNKRAELQNYLVKLTKDKADDAIRLLNEISSDGYLTPQEKPILLRDWLEIREQYPITYSRGVLYNDDDDIAIKMNDYQTAFTDLKDYLKVLIDDGSIEFTGDMATTSVIDGEIFKGKFITYYNARDNLIKEIESHVKDTIDNIQLSAAFVTLSGDNIIMYPSGAGSVPDKLSLTFTAFEHNFVGSPSQRLWQYLDSNDVWTTITDTYDTLTIDIAHDSYIFESRNSVPIRYKVGEFFDQTTINKLYASKSNATVLVSSDFGDRFFGGNINTTLRATVYYAGENITDTIPASAFNWFRKSETTPTADDLIWNSTRGQGKKTITLTGVDVVKKAVFDVEVTLDIN